MATQAARLAKKDEEIEKLKAALLESMKDVQGHQFIWMIDAARDHFEEQIEKTENKILRFERFRKGEKAEFGSDKTVVQEAQEWIDKYKPLLKFLKALKGYVNRVDMDRTAEAIVAGIVASRKT